MLFRSIKYGCRAISVKDTMKDLVFNITPKQVLKLSIVPQTVLSASLIFLDPTTRIFKFCATTIPFLITGHTMISMGSQFFVGDDKMAVSTTLLSGGLFCTSAIALAVLNGIPFLLLIFNIFQ